MKPDARTPGGLKVVRAAEVSPDAQSFKVK